VGHIVTVHESVGVFNRDFQYKLRRTNYVSPKNYLDYINTYLRLLDEKDKFMLHQVALLIQDMMIALWLVSDVRFSFMFCSLYMFYCTS